MIRSWRNIHPAFKLNGVHYDLKELQEVGYSFIKEGDANENAIGDFILDWTLDSPTWLVYTSGSTGEPKSILLKKEHAVNSAAATGQYFGLNPGSNALLCLPLTGIAGKMMLVRAMVLGLELDTISPSSAPLAGNQRRYDFVAMVPLQVERSIGQLSQIKTLIIGGVPVSQSLKEKLKEVPTEAFETYGMTETITHVAVKPIQNLKSNFTALPNITFTQDKRGCLVIDAPKISDTLVITNDLVELISELEFKWLGRYDSIINSGGVKLIPEQIEQKLAPLISSRFFVTGIPDEALGQKLVLVVEGVLAGKDELHKNIKTSKTLGKYEIPKEIWVVPQFIETSTGKVQKSMTLASVEK